MNRKIRTGITEGIISVANHKLRTQGIKEYQEYLSEQWINQKDLTEFMEKFYQRNDAPIFDRFLSELRRELLINGKNEEVRKR